LPNLPADGAAARLLTRDATDGRVVGFRVDRLADGELLLERFSARYLAKVVEGTVAGLRVGMRVRLALDAPLPDVAAGSGAGSPVRARILPARGGTGGAVLELRLHLGPRPTARPEAAASHPTIPRFPASLDVRAPDGQVLRFSVRAAGAPGAVVQAVDSGPVRGGEGPLLAARLVAGPRPGSLALELDGLRFAILGTTSLPPGTRLRLAPVGAGAGMWSVAAPAPAEEAAPPGAGGTGAAAVALYPLDAHGPIAAVRAEGDDLADALLRVLLRTASADGGGPSAAGAGKRPAPLPAGVEPAGDGRPAAGSSAWLLAQPAAEPALLDLAVEPEGDPDVGGPSGDRHFRIDLDLSRLGRVRIELACIGRARHLLLRSERSLSPECLTEIADLFGAALAIAGRPGRFLAGRLASARPGAPPSPASATRAGIWA